MTRHGRVEAVSGILRMVAGESVKAAARLEFVQSCSHLQRIVESRPCDSHNNGLRRRFAYREWDDQQRRIFHRVSLKCVPCGFVLGSVVVGGVGTEPFLRGPTAERAKRKLEEHYPLREEQTDQAERGIPDDDLGRSPGVGPGQPDALVFD